MLTIIKNLKYFKILYYATTDIKSCVLKLLLIIKYNYKYYYFLKF